MKHYKIIPALLLFMLSLWTDPVSAQIQNLPFPDKVSSMAFSPDGKYIAGSITEINQKKRVYLWEHNGGLIRTFEYNQTPLKINRIVFSPDNTYLFAAGENYGAGTGMSIIWLTETGKWVRVIPYAEILNDVAVSPDGKYFAFASEKKSLSLWTMESLVPEKTFEGHSKAVNAVVFGKDSRFMFSGSKDKKIIQWDVVSGQNIRTFIGHENPVTAISSSPDGKLLASGSDKGTIIVWDLSTGTPATTIYNHKQKITSLCFSPDAAYILSGSEDRSSKVFEATTGILVRAFVGHDDIINGAFISPDAKFIATASDDRTIKVWNSNFQTKAIEEESTLSESVERGPEVTKTGSKPSIIWQLPFEPSGKSEEKDYLIRVHIQSDSKLDEVNIFHNSDVDNYDLTSYQSIQQGNTNLTIEREISLEEGNNSITIIAGNSAGSTTSDIRSILYEVIKEAETNIVTWIQPSDENQVITQENFSVKVCIKSAARIDQVSFFINDNLWAFDRTVNLDQTSPDCRLEFEKEIILEEGNNELRIEAVTAEKLNIEASRNIVYQTVAAQGDSRLALVIGNAEYQHGEFLLNPVNDALSMAKALETVGFEVITHTNADQKTIKMAMDEFGEELENTDVGLFYYAGHGLQVDGSNYIIPVDATLYKEQDVDYDCVNVGRILGKMEASGSTTNIIILDACRDNPFERNWSGRSIKTRGLAFMNAPSGSIIAYATSPGNTASDGTGENGLYTGTLLKYIQVPGLQIEEVFKNVRSEVEKVSSGQQTPWESTSLKGEFYFLHK